MKLVEEKRKFHFLLASFVICEILAVAFANNIIISQIPVEHYEPFGNQNVVQASANSGLLVLSVLLFTLFLIGVTKLGLDIIFRGIAILMPVLFLFFFLPFQTQMFSSELHLSDAVTNFLTVLSFLFIIIVGISILEGITPIINFAFILETSLIGSYLAVSFAPPTLFVFPIAFALYDIYAVFKGPLKTLIKVKKLKNEKEVKFINKKFGLLLARIGGVTIGAGDFTFYSMLVAAAFVLKGLVPSILVGISIDVGIIITLYLLEKYKRPLPGLPIPIALGIITMLLV